MSNSSIWFIDRTLCATTLSQSGPWSNGNEGVFCIPQSSIITGASSSDCFMSYPGYLLASVLPLCRDAVSVFYNPNWLGSIFTIFHYLLIYFNFCMKFVLFSRHSLTYFRGESVIFVPKNFAVKIRNFLGHLLWCYASQTRQGDNYQWVQL